MHLDKRLYTMISMMVSGQVFHLLAFCSLPLSLTPSSAIASIPRHRLSDYPLPLFISLHAISLNMRQCMLVTRHLMQNTGVTRVTPVEASETFRSVVAASPGESNSINISTTGCINDIRLDQRYLPMENGSENAAVVEFKKLLDGCPSNNPCRDVSCEKPLVCVDQWMTHQCR